MAAQERERESRIGTVYPSNTCNDNWDNSASVILEYAFMYGLSFFTFGRYERYDRTNNVSSLHNTATLLAFANIKSGLDNCTVCMYVYEKWLAYLLN